MRIVAGNRRGLKLDAPEGLTTRPTSERAREALFNILAGSKYRERLIGRKVTDLFAGTGALGLEALSRGAESCIFVEQDPAAVAVLKKNLARARFGKSAKLLSRDALASPGTGSEFGIVFADPPYRDGIAEGTLGAIVRNGILAPDGIIVLQAHPKTEITIQPGLEVLDDRRYGAARFLILAQSSDA